MMGAETFWTLKRSLRPAKLFSEVLPELPEIFPPITTSRPINLHLRGAGGGVWWVKLRQGRLYSGVGAAPDAICQVSLERGSLRELIGGSLRERGLKIMAGLGQPRQLPDLRALPLNDRALLALAELQGSVAVMVFDRDLRETHRFVVAFGSGEPQWEEVDTTVSYDVDDQVKWVLHRKSPLTLLRSGGIRVEGELAVVVRALQILLGTENDSERRDGE